MNPEMMLKSSIKEVDSTQNAPESFGITVQLPGFLQQNPEVKKSEDSDIDKNCLFY